MRRGEASDTPLPQVLSSVATYSLEGEEDILALVSPFSPGYTPRIYVQAAKGQGFVEFEDTAHATRCLQYFQHNLVQLKGSTLHFSYSTRQSVVTHEQLVQSRVKDVDARVAMALQSSAQTLETDLSTVTPFDRGTEPLKNVEMRIDLAGAE